MNYLIPFLDPSGQRLAASQGLFIGSKIPARCLSHAVPWDRAARGAWPRGGWAYGEAWAALVQALAPITSGDLGWLLWRQRWVVPSLPLIGTLKLGTDGGLGEKGEEGAEAEPGTRWVLDQR